MMRRTILAATMAAALGLTAAPALAANGVTPVSPKAGASVPAGERPRSR